MTTSVPPGAAGGPGPSGVPGPDEPAVPAPEPSRVDLVAAAVLAVDGVAGLHGGALGSLTTYLPGRRVGGVRLAEDVTEIGIAVHFGASVTEVGDRVRAAVAPLVGTPVAVAVQDVVAPGEAPVASGPADPGAARRTEPGPAAPDRVG